MCDSNSILRTAGARNAIILLVDDDPAVRDALGMVLEAEGYQVVSAGDGRQALAAYPELRPDLVITDVIMPHETGLAVLTGIKRMNPAAKVVVMSGGGRTTAIDFLAMASKLGATAVIDKPCDLDELLTIVWNLLSTPTTFVDGST
ncbi:MAG TPA: response regulator, partial [Stellaceae bacterium]|nr:response regulator [Stellaceae bacterium]